MNEFGTRLRFVRARAGVRHKAGGRALHLLVAIVSEYVDVAVWLGRVTPR